ncbi:MAG: tetratricopeptide repeat-containing sensor histidine kinase [Flammeovirgaceae bacterium]
MFKFLTISLLLFTLSFNAYSQQKKYKQKNRFPKQGRLNKNVQKLLEEAEEIRFKNLQAALDKVEEALALSISQKSKVNEAKCYILLGKINDQIEEWELSRTNYLNAQHALKDSALYNTQEQQTILSGLANSNTKMGDYGRATANLQAKKQTLTNPKQVAETLLDMANIYHLAKNDSAALNSVERAEQILLANPDPPLQSKAQAIRASILADQGELEEAKNLYYQSRAIESELNTTDYNKNIDSYESTKEKIIEAYRKNKRPDEEIELRSKTIDLNANRKNSLKVVQEKQALGKALIDQGQTSQAIRQLEDAAALADSLGNYQELANANKALAEAWLKRNNSQRSLVYYRKYSEVMDSVLQGKLLKQTEKERVLKKQTEILTLAKDLALAESKYDLEVASHQLSVNKLKSQQILIFGLLLLLLFSVVGSVVIYRNATKSKTISQLLHLKSLRSQMNPHFIFNALNSVNQFIAMNDERAANKFLSEFSKLMRLVLDTSQEDFISLAQEKEMIALYLKLEHYRFRDKFNYELNIDDEIALDSIEIPPMLIQPYIENAIWHGLRYKEEMGFLQVDIGQHNDQLLITITDNGIGRTQSKALKTKNQKSHQSMGLKNIEERLNIINKVYHKHYEVAVNDLAADGTGTVVKLSLQEAI